MIEFTQKQGTMTSNNESYASNSSPNTLKVAAIVVTPISNIGIESVREFIPSCPDDLKPKLGQEFKDLQEATAFYKRYASTCGFNTRLGTTKARKNDPKTFTVVARYRLPCVRIVSIIVYFTLIDFFCGQWLARRQAHMVRVQQGIPISEFGVLVDMIRVPDWAFEAAGLEMRGMGQDAAPYQPGLYYTSAQREALEALIQELPKFMLKAVPTDCSECPICLEEFRVGNEVRGLPCAHNFHVECIDQWLRLSPKCPRCRCSVFPNLDLSGLSNLRPDSKRERSSSTVVTATQSVRGQTPSQRYRLRLQGFLQPIRSVNGRSSNEFQTALPLAENGRQPTNPVPEHIVDLTSSAASSH